TALHPGREIAEELVTVQFEERLRAPVVLCAPDVLEADEPRAADFRVIDEGDVERRRLAAQGQRIAPPVPAQWIGAAEVHVTRRPEVRMHPDVGVADVDPRLTAVTSHRLEP